MKAPHAEYVILWDFIVLPGREANFEAAYNPAGAWARLFVLSPEFRGTDLLRSGTNPRRYMTVDRWASAEAFQRFRNEHGAEYLALDAQCAQLTESEDEAGGWVTVGNPTS